MLGWCGAELPREEGTITIASSSSATVGDIDGVFALRVEPRELESLRMKRLARFLLPDPVFLWPGSLGEERLSSPEPLVSVTGAGEVLVKDLGMRCNMPENYKLTRRRSSNSMGHGIPHRVRRTAPDTSNSLYSAALSLLEPEYSLCVPAAF